MNDEQKRVFLHRISEQNKTYRYRLPCRHETGRFLHGLLDFLFPLSQDCPNFDKQGDQSAHFDEIQKQLNDLLLPLEGKRGSYPQFVSWCGQLSVPAGILGT